MANDDTIQDVALVHLQLVTTYAITQNGDENSRAKLTTVLSTLNGATSPNGAGPLLPVNYVSQFGTGADKYKNDCGAACGAMLVEAYTANKVSVDDFYVHAGVQGDVYLSATQIVKVLTGYGVSARWQTNLDLGDLYLAMADFKPAICLIKYGVIRTAITTESQFDGPHFLTVIGMDTSNVIVHDPLWHGEGGKALAIPIATFKKAWIDVGHDSTQTNPERGAIIPSLSIGSILHQVRVTAYALNIRSGPSASYSSLGFLKKDDVVSVYEELSGWGRIHESEQRWISLAYTTPV